jgi:hypothetical protein
MKSHIITAACLLAAALSGPALPGDETTEPEGPTSWFPLEFHSEIIKLSVEGDSLTVEGLYRFISKPTELEYTGLFYPYPADSLLGRAHMVALQARDPIQGWVDLIHKEAKIPPGSDWKVPLGVADTLEIRAVYRQHILASYARYIVTSTKAWQQPLRWARFEIRLPEGAEPGDFSFPFERREDEGGVFYHYEAVDFFPDRDIIVEWSP